MAFSFDWSHTESEKMGKGESSFWLGHAVQVQMSRMLLLCWRELCYVTFLEKELVVELLSGYVRKGIWNVCVCGKSLGFIT